jgi:hypothetical protein
MSAYPPRTVITVFAALPEAAHDARTFTARTLTSWGLSDLAETATLLVSELITNAVQHAGGVMNPPADRTELLGQVAPVMLGLSRRTSLVLIEVWDRDQAPPLRRVADDAVGGRGLELVDALSKEWGCDILTTGGKIVWSALETECA